MNLGADITRVWEYRGVGSDGVLDPQRIVLRHNPITQVLSVVAGRNELAAGNLQFRLANGVIGRVVVDAGAAPSFLQRFTKYSYSCLVDDGNGEKKLPESNELAKDMEDGVRDISVSISEVVIDGNKTTWYKIQASMTQVYHGKERALSFLVHRRFRDFRFCYSQILSAYRQTHLASSLPKHPPKEFAVVQDHADRAFLEHRRSALETWLRNTLAFPRAGTNPDMQGFLGMGDATMRETSIMVPTGETLGLKLKKRQGANEDSQAVFPQAAVLTILGGKDGKPSPAQGVVGPGDVVMKIAGESVVQTAYEKIINMLQKAPRPLIVHFLNVGAGSGNAKDDQEDFAARLSRQSLASSQHDETDTSDDYARHQQDEDGEEDGFLGADEAKPSVDAAQPKPSVVAAQPKPSVVAAQPNQSVEPKLVEDTHEKPKQDAAVSIPPRRSSTSSSIFARLVPAAPSAESKFAAKNDLAVSEKKLPDESVVENSVSTPPPPPPIPSRQQVDDSNDVDLLGTTQDDAREQVDMLLAPTPRDDLHVLLTPSTENISIPQLLTPSEQAEPSYQDDDLEDVTF